MCNNNLLQYKAGFRRVGDPFHLQKHHMHYDIRYKAIGHFFTKNKGHSVQMDIHLSFILYQVALVNVVLRNRSGKEEGDGF